MPRWYGGAHIYCFKGHVHLWRVAGIRARVVPNLKVALQDQGFGLGGPRFRPCRARVTALQGQGYGIAGSSFGVAGPGFWPCVARAHALHENGLVNARAGFAIVGPELTHHWARL